MPDEAPAIDLAELRRLAANVENAERLWQDTKPSGSDDAAPAVHRDALYAACLSAWEAWEGATLPATIVPLLDRLASAEAALHPLADELGCSLDLYHKNGPDWTQKDGTQTFDVSVLLDRQTLIEHARAHFARYKRN